MANARNTPDDKSVAAFVNALQGHSQVISVKQRPGTYVLDLRLERGSTLVVYMTNLYVVGQADVVEILGDHGDVDCIVTLSSWNMTSKNAVEYGQAREVGVFKWKEFFGAINYGKYWLYADMPMGLNDGQIAAERKRRRRVWN